MKKLNLMIILGLIFTAPTSAMADDVADIKSVMKEHFVTMNAGDSAGHIAHHKEGNSSFGADGGALAVNDSLEEEAADLQADFDDGIKFDFELVDLEVAVYGDTAVVTSLQTGTVTTPDGKTEKVKNRRTAVVVRDGSDWKEVHSHISAYVEEPTE
jgi:ketosteroid isomerase-like protein